MKPIKKIEVIDPKPTIRIIVIEEFVLFNFKKKKEDENNTGT